MTARCRRCHREFIRPDALPGRARSGKPSPYCPACRVQRRQVYDDARRTERRAAAGPPKTRKAEVTPADVGARGRPCRCGIPVPRTEGPLLVCGLCSRVVAAA